MFEKIYKAFAYIGDRFWWPIWSNIRWCRAIRKNVPLDYHDRIETINDLIRVVYSVYNVFEYTADGVDQLFDSMVPPPQLYTDYLNGKVRDDCDGFHTVIYHCLHNSGFKCALLSVMPMGSGHCVLLFNMNNEWHICDYRTIHRAYSTPEEAVKNYNNVYVNLYDAKSEVLLNGLHQYDYEYGLWKSIEMKDIK